MTDLILYDQMRSAIAKCAAVDEVAGIKNKAAQLEAYARVRDDSESQRRFAEIRLRACIRIGEISRDLETHQGLRANDGTKLTKEETLEQSHIPKRTALHYEELTGGREEQAQKIASVAAESYFAEQQQNEQSVSMGGLKGAVRQALINAFGEPTKKERQSKHEPDLLVHFLYSANWAIEKRNFDPVKLADEVTQDFAQDEIDACQFFIPLLEEFVQQLTKRFNHVK